MVDGTILIVGCGVFGLSTALELVKQGKFVCLIDKYEPPSPWSAANDFNKIIRCEYNDPIYAKLSVEALKLWKSDSIFKKSFNQCGRILVTPTSHKGRIEFEMKGIKQLQSLGEALKYEFYVGGKEIGKKFNCLNGNQIPKHQQIKYNPESGLGYSALSLKNLYDYLSNQPNVRFVFGKSGLATGIKRYDNGDVGVITESGLIHSASTVIIAAGANSGSILDLENQQSATGLFVTHIQLNNEEFEKYKSLPVIFDAEIGYFFPPDPETRIIKLCVTGNGIKRTVSDKFNVNMDISLPRFHNQYPKDTIPKNLVSSFEKLLEKYVPELKNHKLFGSKICWIGDRAKSNFLIDKVPNFTNLFIATGDSGHGYKFLPIIGKYIVQRMDNILDDEISKIWSWNPRLHANMYDPYQESWRIAKRKNIDIKDIDFVIENEISKL